MDPLGAPRLLCEQRALLTVGAAGKANGRGEVRSRAGKRSLDSGLESKFIGPAAPPANRSSGAALGPRQGHDPVHVCLLLDCQLPEVRDSIRLIFSF